MTALGGIYRYPQPPKYQGMGVPPMLDLVLDNVKQRHLPLLADNMMSA